MINDPVMLDLGNYLREQDLEEYKKGKWLHYFNQHLDSLHTMTGLELCKHYADIESAIIAEAECLADEAMDTNE